LPLCVVVPTLNAASGLETTLAAVASQVASIVVADGGSTDRTRVIAEAFGASVILAARGRGPQLRAGAEAAQRLENCGWLLFLHADTRLSPGWAERVHRHITSPGSEKLAGYFRFRLDDPSPAARRLERIVAWRCRRLGLPYGDQALLVHRSLYKTLGGFRPIPLMEDVDLVRRIGRHRLRLLTADALTSAARYRRNGYWRRSLRNLLLFSLYFFGVPPGRLARWYG
jgi:rSAM/selenodomain-associated transferase 2